MNTLVSSTGFVDIASCPQQQQPCATTRRYSPRQWEQHKLRIEQLYVKDRRSLKEVMAILAQETNFDASAKQFKTRISKWGFDVKNVKGDVMLAVARTRAKRKRLDGKDSVFRASKKVIEDAKIDRYLRRKDIAEESLISMASSQDAASPAFSVYTPRPSSPATPRQTTTTDFERQVIASPLSALSYPSFVERSPASGPPFTLLLLQQPELTSSEDPMRLLRQFELETSGYMPFEQSTVNPWWQTVWPLAAQSPALMHAILGLATLRTLPEDQSGQLLSSSHLLQSIRNLRNLLTDFTTIADAAIATALILAVASSTKVHSLMILKKHLEGAKCIIDASWTTKLYLSYPAHEQAPFLSRIRLLACSQIQLDLLVCVMSKNGIGTGVPNPFSNLSRMAERREEWQHLMDLDLSCLLDGMSTLCSQVRSRSSSPVSLDLEKTAKKLKYNLWRWSSAQSATNETSYVFLEMLKIYHSTAILYICQLLPNLCDPNTVNLHTSILESLAKIPLVPEVVILRVFPLLVAGTEATSDSDRSWIREQWKAISQREWTIHVRKCLAVTREIWTRRDLSQRAHNAVISRNPSGTFEGNLESKAGIHWAAVVDEWGWEVPF